MDLEEIIEATYEKGQRPNEDQLKAIEHVDGPLLIVAGPGSGKTKTLITRALNLLLHHEVAPENILLCTFTEKAAHQLRDRLNAGIKKCRADHIDIHEMTIGTIHSVCQKIIDEYPNEAGIGIYSKTHGLGRGYTVLDDIQRMFFLMENFQAVFGDKINERYLGLWRGYWDSIQRCREYFDKITEENIDLAQLRESGDEQVQIIGKAMTAYRRLLIEKGKVDFAHLEWLALDLLKNNQEAKKEFQSKFAYVMVDEYQDTNFIQEQLIFSLANADRNIAVVGDVDQSIYRFRGATTQNIMEFGSRVGRPDLEPINLRTNYRSSQQIIDLYQNYRDETDWHGARYDLNVVADSDIESQRPDYQGTIHIESDTAAAEGQKIADLIVRLKKAGTIQDYNQVAILLYSVRHSHSGQYLEAIRQLRDQGEDIDVYAPRARTFFERPEVMCLLAGMYSLNAVELRDDAGGYPGAESESIKEYIHRCTMEFRDRKEEEGHDAFVKAARGLAKEVKDLKEKKGKPKRRFLEYFYALINTEFMGQWMERELPARHLAQISQLMTTFMEYYGASRSSYEWIGGKSADRVWDSFFNSFLRVLFEGGLNEYEDEEQTFPSGAVQVMTFHQSKGLEFPVVIAGDLNAQITTGKKVDDLLGDYYERTPHEPRHLISEFDKRRLYYVAFSRAKDFLVLTYHNSYTERVLKRRDHFAWALGQCEDWNAVKRSKSYELVQCKAGDEELLKPVLGFTSHISAYERCPLQFKLQKLYGFTPVRNEQLWMGNVVHNTLKDIHDHVLKKKPGDLDGKLVKTYLDQNIDSLRRAGNEPPQLSPERQARGDKSLEEVALESVQRYVRENGEKLKHCRWAEKEILVDEQDYTLTGVIDLLIHDDTGQVELVDFKAGQRKNNEQYREGYADQVRLYCQQVEPKVGKVPDEAYLYWITEPGDNDPKDPVDADSSLIAATKERVDKTARSIVNKNFPKLAKQQEHVCGTCEFCQRCWS